MTLSISRKSAGKRKRALPMRELWLDFAIKSPAWNSSSSNAKRSSQVKSVRSRENVFQPCTSTC